MSAPERSGTHLSIGEVLANLQDEFPDVTVSKIRFLESQGLIDPERTPSGYRRFYGPDLERLRWILFQQREHFLPLRVIKDRLDRFGASGAPPIDSMNGDRPAVPVSDERRRLASVPTRRTPPRPADALTLPLDTAGDDLGTVASTDDTVPHEHEITRAELLRDSGLGAHALEELEAFGIILPIAGNGENAIYDDELLDTARVAAGYYSRGITARHLRMYQHFADREAELFSQVLLPYRRQRTPTARTRLQLEAEELARLGGQLRTAMLRQALRDALRE